MLELKNISVKEYFGLPEVIKNEYDFAIKYAKFFQKSIDIFNVGDFTQMKFGFIKDLQGQDFNLLTWDIFLELCAEMTKKKITEISEKTLLEILQFKNYIVSEIYRINQIESNLLSHDADSSEKEAGVEKFEVFGSYPQLRNIALTFGITINQARELKYTDCLTELYYQKTQNDFQKALNKVYERKQKR